LKGNSLEQAVPFFGLSFQIRGFFSVRVLLKFNFHMQEIIK